MAIPMTQEQPKSNRKLASLPAIACTFFAVSVSASLINKLRKNLSKNGNSFGKGTPVHAHSVSANTNPTTTHTQESERMIALYEKMGREFASSGLDVKSIKDAQSWYHNIEEQDALPWPKKYSDFVPSLPPNSVRLLVIPLMDVPKIAAAGVAISQQVMRLLPPNTKVFGNARQNYHCTIFHASHPSDVRPNTFKPNGDVNLELPNHERRCITASELEVEEKTIRGIVAKTTRPVLQFRDVVMAPSGTLLFTWIDDSPSVHNLRSQLRTTFPGATTRQANIIHTSLLRVVSDEPLPKEVVTSIQEVCKSWTSKLQGSILRPSDMWYVKEMQFSTIEGDREVLRFAPV